MNNYQEFDEEKLMYIYNNPQTRFYDEDENSSMCGEIIQVNQHLEPEQYKYEFPTKMCLKELSLHLDNGENTDTFFDESSFITIETNTTATALSSDKHYFNGDHHMNQSLLWHETLIEEEEEEDEYIQDFKLSPLQLPAQVVNYVKHTNTNSASTGKVQQRPVGPSSFLSDNMYNKHAVTQQQYIHKGYSSLSFSDDNSNDSIPIMDTDNDSSTTESSSIRSTESRTVLIKLNKKKFNSNTPSLLQQHSTTLLEYISNNDEGYDDNEEDELESHCVFYPLNETDEKEMDNELIKDKAAIKIQSLWRGYSSRKFNKNNKNVIFTRISSILSRRQFNIMDNKLLKLQEKLQEETAMRMAFEKAMEDMTVLIDQQQKILYDRLEQEVHMRQLYENKMNQALKQLQPLESRLKKEVAARYKMEEMMTRVLDQMHESETLRQQQAKDDAESKKLIQIKLEQAMDEISIIKKNTMSVRSSTITQQQKPAMTKRYNTSSTTTATNTSNSTTTKPTVRKSIVPATKKLESTTTATPTLRRQQQQQQRISSINTNQPRTPLYERPSVIPSNRRPLAASSTTKRIQTTSSTNNTQPPRRPLLTRK